MATAATRNSSGRGSVIALGIESTAHTFGVGIVSDRKPYILADIRYKYMPSRGGILPREVAQYFSTIAGRAVREALDEAGLGIRDLSLIAVALGPGMGPALRIGATVARALSAAYDLPLIPVNHGIAHIEIARFFSKARDPVVLYVSGGTTVIATYSYGRYRIFGETLDIALGNLLDTFAREAGLAPPYIVKGEHVVDLCAKGGRFLRDFPYTVKGQDVSYSGLLTKALRSLARGVDIRDVCYTLREIAFSSAIEVTERCLAHTRKHEVILTGGVAANPVLNDKALRMSKLHQAGFQPIPRKYAGDNGVMIAMAGILAFKSGLVGVKPEDAIINQRWRLDRVDVAWFPKIFGE